MQMNSISPLSLFPSTTWKAPTALSKQRQHEWYAPRRSCSIECSTDLIEQR